jgi:hypothetical protein
MEMNMQSSIFCRSLENSLAFFMKEATLPEGIRWYDILRNISIKYDDNNLMVVTRGSSWSPRTFWTLTEEQTNQVNRMQFACNPISGSSRAMAFYLWLINSNTASEFVKAYKARDPNVQAA